MAVISTFELGERKRESVKDGGRMGGERDCLGM